MTPDEIIAGLRQVQEALGTAILATHEALADSAHQSNKRALAQLPALIAAVEAWGDATEVPASHPQGKCNGLSASAQQSVEALTQPQELTEDDREEIIRKVQDDHTAATGKYRDMSIRTVIEAYEAALKAAGCKIVR